MENKLNVLIIDPRGYKTPHYPNGLCSGLSEKCDLTIATSYHYVNMSGANYKIERCFFKVSDKLKNGYIKKGVRAIEYIKGYQHILNMVKHLKYDVVHVQWCLFYPVDCYFLNQIKKYVGKVIYTAHNVIRHVNGEKDIRSLRKLYSLFDSILVHGEEIKNEFNKYFPELLDRVKIQFHGTYLNKTKEFDSDRISPEIVKKINRADKIYIYFGYIFYNKGADLLIKNWKDITSEGNSLLIVAGSVQENYKEYVEAKKEIVQDDNFILIEGYVDENLLNYLLAQADIVLMPYRHASMSGVVFTAAEFSKTILCTDAGSLKEYLEPGEDSFVCSLDDYIDEWKNIERSCSKEKLSQMGVRLNRNIQKKYDWNTIAEQLIKLYQE